MRYLVVDACLNGTGIRDYYQGGYINPEELNLSPAIKKRLEAWLSNYQNEHFKGYKNLQLIDQLDNEGKQIALQLKEELPQVKVQYFSDANMTKDILP